MSPVLRPDNIIPVPPIPQAYAPVGSSHRRTASLQTRGRAISPPDKNVRVRRLSVDESSGPLGIGCRGTTRAAGSPDSQRPGSINFSYPMNARPNSPRLGTFACPHPTDIYNSQELSKESQSPVTVTKRVSPTGQRQNADAQRADARVQDAVSNVTLESRISSGNSYESLERGTSMSQNLSQQNPGANGRKTPRVAVDSFDLRIQKRRPSTVREDGESETQKPQHDEEMQRVRTTAKIITKPANVGNGPSTAWLRHPEGVGSNHGEANKRRAITGSSLPPSGQVDGPCSFGLHHNEESNGSTRVPARSISQSRATRFSDHLQIAQDEPLHSPPPRSMSPAKPALKRSTSHSRSPARPPDQQALTEVTDERFDNSLKSIGLEEPSRTMSKKKTTKVSFEDDTGRTKDLASSNISPVSSAPSSPQENAIPKAVRSSTGRDSLRGKTDVDEFDSVLTPRPALPSFGSIRGRRRLIEEVEGNQTRQEMPPEGRTPVHLLFSNDHAIGGLLHEGVDKTSETQTSSDLPLPPEVTSVEGNGYDYSSSDSSDSDDTVDPNQFSPPGDELHTPPRQSPVGTDSAQKKERQHVTSLLQAVPIVSVQPATPKSEVAQPDLGNGVTASPSSVAGAKVEDSDSESGESIYSDAAEDLSDLDGDGFGSINAIVDSPVSMLPSFQHASSPPSSPSVTRTNGRKPDNTQIGNISDLATWSPISRSNAPMDAPRLFTEYSVQDLGSNGEPTTQNSARRYSPHVQITKDIQRDVSRDAERPISSSKDGETQRLGSSLSPSGSVVRNGSAKYQRHNTYHTEYRSNQPVQRSLSNGSDSSSSFKRSRRSPPSTGRYALRRTLRSPGGHSRSFSTSAAASTGSPRSQRQLVSPEGKQSVLRTTLRVSPSGTTTKVSSFGLSGQPTRAGTFPRRNIFQIASPKSDARKSRFEDSSGDEMDFRPVRGIPRRAGAVDGDSTELEDSSDSDSQPNVIRRRRLSHSRRPVTPKPTLPVVPNTEKTEEIADGNLDYFLPQYRKQRIGLLNRLSLSRRSRRNDASRIGKLELESAARRDMPLERSKLELERARITTPSPVPTVSNTDKSPSTPPPKKWHSMSPKLQKRVSRRAGSGSWLFRSSDNTPGAIVGTSPAIPEANEQAVTTNGKNAHRPHTSDGVVKNGTPSAPVIGVSEDGPQSKSVDTNIPRTPLSDGGDSSMGKKRRFPLLRKALGLRK